MISVTTSYQPPMKRSGHVRRASFATLPIYIPQSNPTTPTLSRNILRQSIELLTNSNDTATSFIELISRAREGLKYHEPELCEEGVNGTYFLRDKSGEVVAVFKPEDEEANSENNPKKGNDSRSSLPNEGIRPGEAASREVAAHLLDRESLFGVPKTQLVKVTHEFGGPELQSKTGSLQEFIENDGSSEDYGCRSFPVSEVHKIGILDVQILNVDRHAGNILISTKSNSATLTPIDQGFSLLDNLECPWFEWMNWPQSKLPFNDDHKSYITRIDIDKDSQMLTKELGIRSECVRTYKIMTSLLKESAESDLTLHDIGSIICRLTPGAPSILESAYVKAESELRKKLEIADSESLDPFLETEENEKAFIKILLNLLETRLTLVPISRRVSI